MNSHRSYHPPGVRRDGREAAFCQTELFVFLACVGFLVLLVVPARGQARGKFLRVGCVENLAQIGRAVRSYADSHGGRFPAMVPNAEGGAQGYLQTATHSSEPGLWRCYWVLSNELVHPRVLTCPADSGRYHPASWTEMADARGRNGVLSYGVGTGASPSKPRMILAADRSIEWTNNIRPYLFNDFISGRSTIGTDATRIASMIWDPVGMHSSAGNVLFADGSVSRLNSEGLRNAWLNSGDTRNAYSQPGKSAQ